MVLVSDNCPGTICRPIYPHNNDNTFVIEMESKLKDGEVTRQQGRRRFVGQGFSKETNKLLLHFSRVVEIRRPKCRHCGVVPRALLDRLAEVWPDHLGGPGRT